MKKLDLKILNGHLLDSIPLLQIDWNCYFRKQGVYAVWVGVVRLDLGLWGGVEGVRVEVGIGVLGVI